MVGCVSESQARWTDSAPGILVERDGEVAQLRRRVDALRRHGRSAMVTVTGRRGVGLSALLKVAVAQARAADVGVALARCSPAEADIRHGVISQLTAGLGPHSLPSLAAEEPARTLVPALCAEFLAVARRRPLLVAVDDVQWADQESLEWLRAMARRVHQAPMLLVQATTAAEQPTGSDRWLVEPRPEAARVLRLRPLRERGVRRVITSRYAGPVDSSFVAGATEATGGNPAVLRAVLNHFALESLPPLAEHVPEFAARAAEVIGDRQADAVASLPDDALALLRAIALGGDSLGFDLAATLAGSGATAHDLTADPVSDNVALLARLGLVVGADEPRVAGPVVAARALSGMAEAERAQLATRAVELGYRAAIAEDRLADLLLAAPPLRAGWVVDLLRRVALRRRISGAHRVAAALLTRALREPVDGPERHHLRIELGMSEVAYRPRASDRRLHRVLLDSGAGVPGPLLVEAADLMHSRGDVRSAHRAIATACERASTDTASLAAIGWLAENESGADPVLPVLSFPALPDRPADPVQAAAVAWLLTLDGRDRDRARELARRALPHPVGAAEASGPLGPRIYACRVLNHSGDLAEAVLGLDRVLADARRRGARVPAALALRHLADCELRRGNLDKAAEDLAATRDQLPLDSWHPSVLPGLVAVEGALLLARGEPERAARLLAKDLPAGADDGAAWGYLLFERGQAAMALADPATALRHFHDCGRILLGRRWANPALLAWREQAVRAHLALDDVPPALRLYRDAIDRAHAWGAPDSLGRAQRLMALLTDPGLGR
jgi:tetratricopeptide (TPR) repeat protein